MEKETIERLMLEVKEEGLPKDKLEALHTEITYLDNVMRMAIAPLEKEEALFMSDEDVFNREFSVAAKKLAWKSTKSGQRQIELSHYLKITPKLLQSLKTRLYSIY